MEVEAAARRWAETWARAWPRADVEAVAALYADDVVYRALVFREPDRGVEGVRRYLTREFGVESDVECRFGDPVVGRDRGRDRAAVEWWASWIEEGKPITLAGTTILRFDPDGLVIDHRDYWNSVDRREPPFDGW